MSKLRLVLLVGLLLIASISYASAEPVEIRFAWWGSVARHEIYNEIVDMFEAEHPDIKVAREYGSWADYWDRLTTQAAAGNQPDVMQFNSFTIAEYSDRGVLLDLEPLVEQGLINVDGWDPIAVDVGRRDGVLYALPFSFTISSTVMNISMLERIGVEVPDVNKVFTLDEFADFVLEVQAGLDAAGIDAWALQDPTGFENWFETFIRQRGKNILSEDEKSLGFDRQDLIDYFSYHDRLRKAGAIPPAEIMAEEGGQPWENSMLANKRVVISFTNSNQLKYFQMYMGDDILEVYRNPVDPEGALPHGEPLDYMTNGISAQTKHPEAAAKFVDFFTNNVEAQRVFQAEHGAPTSPQVIAALGDEFGRAIQSTIRHMQQVQATVPPYYGRPSGIGPIMTGIGQANDAIAFGAKSVEQAVNDFLREAERTVRRR